MEHLIPLPRAVLHITGPDSRRFLQGIITNDMGVLDHMPVMYACLLNHQGKFLHDFFVVKGHEGDFYLDGEGGSRAVDLLTRLKAYKMRWGVQITINPNIEVAAQIETQDDIDHAMAAAFVVPDPRDERMGRRVLIWTENAAAPLPDGDFATWDLLRLSLGIPDGSRDAEVGTSTLEELNIPRLHGVSFTKGCYVGQEVTARMHNREAGGKFHLHPVTLTEAASAPLALSDIFKEDVLIGKLRSHRDHLGLALLMDTAVEQIPAPIILHPTDKGWII